MLNRMYSWIHVMTPREIGWWLEAASMSKGSPHTMISPDHPFPHFPPTAPPPPPFPLMGITAIIFTYVVICYLVVNFVGQAEGINGIPSGTEGNSSGLSNQELEKLPCFHFDYDEGKTSTCAVCYDGFLIGESCRIFPACNHVYHAQCIDLWLVRRLTCPICRAPFEARVSSDVV